MPFDHRLGIALALIIQPENTNTTMCGQTESGQKNSDPIAKETYEEMKRLIHLYENPELLTEEPPYLFTYHVEMKRHHNPNYGSDRVCECGHPYRRHFDTWEGMEAVGCKYCECYTFVEAGPPPPKDEFTLDFERVFGTKEDNN